MQARQNKANRITLIILAAVITFCLYRVYQQKKVRAALKQRIEEIRENNSRLAAES